MAAPGKLRSLANLSNEQEFVTNLRDSSLSFEGNFHASDLLRCASTSAYEFSDSMSGAQRDMTVTIMHLVEMAKVMVDNTIENLQTQ
ncbi:hypothetical protein RYA05_33860 [Pseudomonas syringae pv. actinidiae]|uniref:DNA-directed RNA polymerase n=1 Tax=Pseudomonas syringae pv. actinidiae TaxID=103796 RepID=A0A2V0QEE3_PSESF|nr:hypothetical protein [Pseudomonas syringae]EPN20555.1 hypothetical protein A259_09119 [Pseudomonas syringae pv. actinidiae ICMP 19070]EPN58629.1 hypothetical protein A235_28988 [Pseudomonas syringae pv. actinidiae ICMP 19079]EPN85097.1 hypothetical protein A234_08791 [Pseudomonas syringae pv. actinidiae ICMP 19101]AKT33137.1 hypothetical protein IYO_027160 [Pseudomonas syringae pv. actinidiae ICMP 18884]AOE59429.1 hypothetical protein NZ708_27030 [Pseudomonas syringae pv. actinidiae ICMP 18